jgi:hypothetical protein
VRSARFALEDRSNTGRKPPKSAEGDAKASTEGVEPNAPPPPREASRRSWRLRLDDVAAHVAEPERWPERAAREPPERTRGFPFTPAALRDAKMPLVLREARIRAEAETTDAGERRATRTSKTRVEGARDALEAAVALISAVAAGRRRRPAREDPGGKHDPESGRRRRPAREDPGEDPEPVVAPAIRSEPFRTVGDPFGPEGSAVAARAFDAPAEEFSSEPSSEPSRRASAPAPAVVDDAWFDARGLPRANSGSGSGSGSGSPASLGGGDVAVPGGARWFGGSAPTPGPLEAAARDARPGGSASSFAKTPPIASSASFHAERVDLVLRPGFTWGPGGGRAGGVERSDAVRGDGVAVSAAGVALRVDAFADDDDDDDHDDDDDDARSRETTTRRRVPSSAASAGSAFGSPRVVVVPSRRVVKSYAARVADAAAFDLAPASRRKWRRVLGADEWSARESGAAGATLRAEMDVSVAADDKTRGRACSRGGGGHAGRFGASAPQPRPARRRVSLGVLPRVRRRVRARGGRLRRRRLFGGVSLFVRQFVVGGVGRRYRGFRRGVLVVRRVVLGVRRGVLRPNRIVFAPRRRRRVHLFFPRGGPRAFRSARVPPPRGGL